MWCWGGQCVMEEKEHGQNRAKPCVRMDCNMLEVMRSDGEIGLTQATSSACCM